VDVGLDVVIEASGAEPCMQLGIALLRYGGTCE
jgi:threonine dehydrogenase-like Zn-dependent dehydrogenase